jgi:hypothetical protein
LVSGWWRFYKIRQGNALLTFPLFSVLLGSSTNSPLCRQSILNRSMDALNDRIVHYAANRPMYYADALALAQYHQQLQFDAQQHPTSSSSSRVVETLGRNWRIRPPVIMPREYVVDPMYVSVAPIPPPRSGQMQRYRAKSLDHTNR